MGSPYMMADLKLEGVNVKIPKTSWQDKFAISENKKFIVLIRFELTDNEPGFVFYIINTEKEKVKKTQRIFGLINSVGIENQKIKFNKFLYDKTKSKKGELCCNIDEELEIE